MMAGILRLGSLMKKIAAGFVFAVLCIIFCAQAADEPPAFTGTWTLDKAKSDAAPRPVVSLGAAPGRGGMGGGMPPMGGGMGGGMGRGGGMGGPGMGGPKPGSKAPGNQSEPKIYPMIIEQSGEQVKITTTMMMGEKEFPIVDTVQCDGKEHEAMVPNMFGGPPGGNQPSQVKQVTKANLKKNKLEIERKTFYQENAPRKEKRTYSLSKDGKVLTQKTTTETLMTMPGMPASNMITVQEQVYNRDNTGLTGSN